MVLDAISSKCICSSTYYLNPSDNTCKPCENPNCNTCNLSNPNICLTCASPRGLLSGNCVNDCGPKYYIDSITHLCQQCTNFSCLKCNENDCTACPISLYLFQGNCLSNCPSYFTVDQVSQTCISCSQSECSSCQTSPNLCSQCNSPKPYLDINSYQCLSNCLGGFYLLNDKCLKCTDSIPNCTSCTSTLSTVTCDTCTNNLFLSPDKLTCLGSCPLGSITDTINKKCLSCTDSSCSQCQSSNLDICLQCIQPKILNVDKCVNSCPSGKYQDQYNTCQPCTNIFSQCQSCNNITCLACDTNFPYMNSSSTGCIQSCPPHEYLSSLQKCEKCVNTNCKECDQTNSQNCISCSNNTNGRLYLYNKNCESVCPLGYYEDTPTNKCLPCSSKFQYCEECTDTICLSCALPYFINQQNNECEVSCKVGTGVIITTSTPERRVCDDYKCSPTTQQNCQQCSVGTVSVCLICKPGNYLKSDNCVENCGLGYYIDSMTNKCESCQTRFGVDCQECDSLSCTKNSCQNGLVYTSNSCQSNCQDGYFSDSNKFCQPCSNTSCLTCNPNDSTKCISCSSTSFNKLLENGNCVSQCSEGYYQNAQSCDKCGDNCLVCISLKCQKCSSSYVLDIKTNTCINSCQLGSYQTTNYLNQKVCIQCSNLFPNCSECSPTQCTKCDSIAPILNSIQNTCNSECPDGYYNSSNVCKACLNTYCKKCDTIDSNICLSCKPSSSKPYLKISGECVSSCEVDDYLQSSDFKCLKCSTQYSSCSQCNEQTCLKCSNPKEFIDQYGTKQCVSQCNEGMYGDSFTNKCENCQNIRCQKCSSTNSQICISCNKNSFLDQQDCVTQCKQGYYGDIDTQICKVCQNANCYECDPSKPNQCLSCSINIATSDKIYLYKNDCVSHCSGYLIQNTNKCYDQCPDAYITNESTKECEECPHFIMNGQCIDQCPLNTYLDGIQSKLCNECSKKYGAECLECNESQCVHCIDNFFLFKKNCYNKCPDKTFRDEEEYRCLEECNTPNVIQSENVCKKQCPSGYIASKPNEKNQSHCQKCISNCQQEQDNRTRDIDIDKIMCSSKSLDDKDKCEQLTNKSSSNQMLILITSLFVLTVGFFIMFGINTFLGVFSIYFIQLIQQLGCFIYLADMKFLILKDAVLKYFVAFNIFNLIPLPFERSSWNEIISFYNDSTNIIPIPNISSHFYMNNFYQLILITLLTVFTLVFYKLKVIQQAILFIKNNVIQKLLLIISNMILFTSLTSLTNSQLLATLDIVWLAISLFAYISLQIYFFYLTRNNNKSNNSPFTNYFFAQCINQASYRRFFWFIFEFRKMIAIISIVVSKGSLSSIYISISLSATFMILMILFKPFQKLKELLFIIVLEIMSLLLQIMLLFIDNTDFVEGNQVIYFQKKIQQIFILILVYLYMAVSYFIMFVFIAIFIIILQNFNSNQEDTQETKDSLVTYQVDPFKAYDITLKDISILDEGQKSKQFLKTLKRPYLVGKKKFS